MILLFVFLVVLTVFVNVYGYMKNETDCACGNFGIMLIFITTLLGVCLFGKEPKLEPMAIDVYRGNTALEITYRDNIPVDTIVIWKEEDYENNRK